MPTYPSSTGTGPVDSSRLDPDVLDKVYTVADAAARLAITAYEGDESIQLDDGSQWIYDGSVWIVRPSSVGGAPSGAASGDLGDFYPNPSVTGLQGDIMPVFSGGDVLARNTADTAWVSAEKEKDTYVPSLGQVNFMLTGIPLNNEADLSVNGVDYERGPDYTVSGMNVTWLNTQFSMETDDSVVIRYMKE